MRDLVGPDIVDRYAIVDHQADSPQHVKVGEVDGTPVLLQREYVEADVRIITGFVDQAPVLEATVQWGVASGRLGHGKKVGVVVSDQAGDQTALKSYLLPDLKKAGITPQAYTVSAGLNETASTDSDAQLAVERLKAAGVQSVIPMLPENAFFPYIGVENQQKFFPQLLLSDYQSTVEVALGLIPQPYE
jgi:hypothetical protein